MTLPAVDSPAPPAHRARPQAPVPQPPIEGSTFERLRAEGDAVRWATLLAAAEVPHVFLKGVGFDAWLGRTRVWRDIDLLVPRVAEPAVRRLLRHHGYRRVVTEPFTTTWLGPAGRLPVDLHVSLKGTAVPPQAVWQAVVAQRTEVVVGGMPIPVLGPPVRELVAALHVVLSGGEAGPLDDLRRALAASAPVDWEVAGQLATRFGCRRLFDAGVAAARPAGHDSAGPRRDIPVVVAGGVADEVALSLLLALLQPGAGERTRQVLRFLRVHPLAMQHLVGGDAGSHAPHQVAARLARQVALLARAVPTARRWRRVLLSEVEP